MVVYSDKTCFHVPQTETIDSIHSDDLILLWECHFVMIYIPPYFSSCEGTPLIFYFGLLKIDTSEFSLGGIIIIIIMNYLWCLPHCHDFFLGFCSAGSIWEFWGKYQHCSKWWQWDYPSWREENIHLDSYPEETGYVSIYVSMPMSQWKPANFIASIILLKSSVKT